MPQKTDPPGFPEIELTVEEKEKCREQSKYIASKVVATTFLHPLGFVRTLTQFGHEPYPLVSGKKYILLGGDTKFLPNVFKYLINIYQSHGLRAIYTGIGANILAEATTLVGNFATNMYIDKYYPELGGDITDITEKGESELDDSQELRLSVRQAIRDSVSLIAALIISRPFRVIMTRQIAQFVGGEGKYAPIGLLQPLFAIGDEEGPFGLFSGLIPNIISTLVCTWGLATLNYGIAKIFKYIEREQDVQDEETRNSLENMRKGCKFVGKYTIGSIRYPYDLVSTVMAVSGSGLFVSLLPYSPVFTHWEDVYLYLRRNGELYRGSRLFLREHKGSYRTGEDGLLYASKKYSI